MNKPNIFRRFTLWVVDSWRLVMNAKYNPLKYIPDPSLQTYFMLVLFTMWSVYFGFVASYYMGWLGYSTVTSIVVHIAILLPIAFTNAVFIDAERDGSKWVKDWRDEQESWKFWLKISSRNYEKRVKWDIDKEA
jgi:uncharacterized membrane protein (DUF485 family)